MIPIAAVAVTLVAAATALWGWPGIWAALALLPASLIGGTVGHVRGALRKRHDMRVGVIGIGLGLTLVALPGALLILSAVNAPMHVVIEETATLSGAPGHVWSVVGDPAQRTRWNVWVKDLEPIGTDFTPSPGQRYRSTLELGGRGQLPAEQHVVELAEGRALVWEVSFSGGAAVEDLREGVHVAEDASAASRVTYRLTYTAPTVLSRVANRLMLEPALRELAKQSLAQLARVLGE